MRASPWPLPLLVVLGCRPDDDGIITYDDTGGGGGCPTSTWSPPALQASQTDPTFVSPKATGGGVSNDDGRGHYYLVPEQGVSEDALLVILPGTDQYTDEADWLLRLGAASGYRSVVLNYPRDPSPAAACAAAGKEGQDAAECMEQVHAAVVFGTGDTDAVEIEPGDSIQNRLYRLLLHLQTEDPETAWSDFYRDEELRTDRIVLLGVAEGAAHAGYWSRDIGFARVALVGGAGDAVYTEQGVYDHLARWVTDPRSTSGEETWAFWHEAQSDAAIIDATLSTWGADTWGPSATVEDGSPPWACTHRLSTGLPGSDGYSGDPVATLAVDDAMALGDDGFPVVAPAVLYILAAPSWSP
jgi:hypothetical protein